jgi:hypothetical protein
MDKIYIFFYPSGCASASFPSPSSASSASVQPSSRHHALEPRPGFLLLSATLLAISSIPPTETTGEIAAVSLSRFLLPLYLYLSPFHLLSVSAALLPFHLSKQV